MCLATSNNLWLVLQDAPNRIFFMNSRSSGQPKKRCKDPFFQVSSPFPGNFCNCNSIGICTASQFQVQLPVIHSVKQRLLINWPEMTLQPLATSCAKDYKQHSLLQTSFTELPNRRFFFQKKLKEMDQINTQFTSLYISHDIDKANNNLGTILDLKGK